MPESEAGTAGGHVQFRKKGAVATLCINRPEKRNALALQTIDELLVALGNIEADRAIRVVILSGAGSKAFASGVDLDELPRAFNSPASARAYDTKVTQLYETMASCRQPIIASMAGHAFGGGCLLALACDLRVAAGTIRIGFPVTRIGLLLSPYEHRLLLDYLTPAHAKWLIFSAQNIEASQALALGLVDCVVSAQDLDDRVEKLAADIADGAPLATQCTKAMLNALAHQEDVERTTEQAYQTIYASTDLIEGLAAARARRKPKFNGT